MRVGVLGSADVGQALSRGFASRGHDVKLGSRSPKSEALTAWLKEVKGKASTGTFEEAARHGETIVIATRGSAFDEVARLAGPKNFAGKVVIDVTNPFKPTPAAPFALALGFDDSGGEQVQRWLAKSRVVKAFNIVGNAHMVKPQFPGGPPDMFICGNDGDAKQTVDSLVRSLGWPPAIDIGRIEGARLLEPLCILWVVYGARTNTWNHAFKLLRR